MIEVEYIDLDSEDYHNIKFAFGYSINDALRKAGHTIAEVKVLHVNFID